MIGEETWQVLKTCQVLDWTAIFFRTTVKLAQGVCLFLVLWLVLGRGLPVMAQTSTAPHPRALSSNAQPVALEATTDASAAETNAMTPTLKIDIDADGVYALTYADLAAAGWDVERVDPRRFRLRVGGGEVSIWVTGEEDGAFDPDDEVLFYGMARDDRYTDTNVYWLTVGDGTGRRMAVRDGTPSGGAPTPVDFPITLHAETNSHYWQTLPHGEGQDHWFWDDKLTAPETRTYTVTTPYLVQAPGAATVRVQLRGRTTHAVTPNHHTRIYLNDSLIDDRQWSGQIAFTHQVTVPLSTLQDGANSVRVEGVGDTGAPVDQFFVDWIELDYPRAYAAAQDQLRFTGTTTGTFEFRVTGFHSPDVQLFDVTDPADVVRITGVVVDADGAGYALRFEDAATPITRYLALTPARRRSPARIRLERPSTWKSPDNGADYVIITHRDFLSATLPLADYRRRQGLRVAVVDVEDVYDEFSAGIFDPRAIRAFLAYAYQEWQPPAPTYVLLVGDANQDYRDYLGTGTPNTVPTQIVQTAILGETPSDNWFVAVDGADPLPDMHIGRLSVQSSEETAVIVEKILRYEQSDFGGSWRRQGVLVADDDSATFIAASEKLAALAPEYVHTRRIYAANYPPGDPVAELAAAWNAGALFVNYTGHGSVSRWGSWNENQAPLLAADQIGTLANGDRLPIVTMANCLSGFFPGPAPQISVAERLLRRSGGGAVAVWAPTGLSYPAGHEELLKAFYRQLFREPSPSLGAAIDAAKATVYAQSPFWTELVDMFVLFGDPAMKVVIPPPMVYLPAVMGE